MTEAPKTEAMSREGKGTEAASEAGRSRLLSWSEAEGQLARGGWFWLATVRPGRQAARDASVRGVVRYIVLCRQQEPGA